MEVVTLNRSLKIQPSFYIAKVGLVGKPLWTPYTAQNSLGVLSQDPHTDFQKVLAGYEAGIFKFYERGTAQQFITLKDARIAVARCEVLSTEFLKQLGQAEKQADKKMQEALKQKEALRQLRRKAFGLK